MIARQPNTGHFSWESEGGGGGWGHGGGCLRFSMRTDNDCTSGRFYQGLDLNYYVLTLVSH